jgi:hypothetical protein
VTGRADVILDQEGGVPTALAIVDYKTATHGEIDDHALQLQMYSDAGRREGLDVRAAYVHDLKAASRNPVPVDPAALSHAEALVAEAATRIRARDYRPSPGVRCRRCCRFSSFLSSGTSLTWPDASCLIDLSPAFFHRSVIFLNCRACDDRCDLSADDQPGIIQATRLPSRRVITGGYTAAKQSQID